MAVLRGISDTSKVRLDNIHRNQSAEFSTLFPRLANDQSFPPDSSQVMPCFYGEQDLVIGPRKPNREVRVAGPRYFPLPAQSSHYHSPTESEALLSDRGWRISNCVITLEPSAKPYPQHSHLTQPPLSPSLVLPSPLIKPLLII